MKFQEIVDAARRTTALSDLDRDSWREGLEIVLRDHATFGSLSVRGETALRERYVNALATRMRVDDYLRNHPELTHEKIERPVFILGMPRTGTTMVSYMMDADPANRSLLKWEAYDVTRPAAPGALRSDPRCLVELAKDKTLIESTRRRWRRTSKPAMARPSACTCSRRTSSR